MKLPGDPTGIAGMEALIKWVYDGEGVAINARTFERASYFADRCILCARNDVAEIVNAHIVSRYTPESRGDDAVLELLSHSIDTCDGGVVGEEFLNSQAPGGMPGHVVVLKVGLPYMLLRNMSGKSVAVLRVRVIELLTPCCRCASQWGDLPP